MNPILWPNHDMPSADDPEPPDADSETLEQSLARLEETIDRHMAERAKIRAVLARFYRSPISASSLQPVLQLAEELDPSLKDTDILTPDSSPF